MFEPDHAAATAMPSPNHDERAGGARPDILLLHYTGMPDEQDALRRLCDPAAKVSAHYLVFENGHVAQLVPEARRAWHAGAGSWKGRGDINSRSIGIEIANPGHAGGLPEYPDRQIAAVISLCADIVRRHAIAPRQVLAHSDTAPSRKEDPGEKFPWWRLAEAGIGHFVRPVTIRDGATLARGAEGPTVLALQRDLADYGYGIAPSGIYDAETEIVVTAFQRHFRPERVDGIADLSTLATLADLLGPPGERNTATA